MTSPINLSGGKTRREITIGHDTCLLGFTGRESVDSAVFDTTTLTAGGVDEQQVVTLTGGPTGGTFRLTFKGQQTADIAYNATAAAVQTALQALTRLGAAATVAGAAGGPYTVTFSARYGGQNVDMLTAQSFLTGGTTPGVTVAESRKGSSKNRGFYVIESGLVLTKNAAGTKVIEYTGAGNLNEIQTVTISGVPTGGTFDLVFDGERTALLPFNATAAAVQTALEALPNIDPGDVTVTGGPGPATPYVVTFGGQYGETSVAMFVPESQLTGGTTPAVSVAQTQQGGEGQPIVGIFDGRREFLSNDGLDDRPIPVYNYNCVFDKDKVKGYAQHQAALERWGRRNACVFKSQGV